MDIGEQLQILESLKLGPIVPPYQAGHEEASREVIRRRFNFAS